MSKRTTQHTETEAGLRLEYIMAAAWYYLKAEGRDENQASVLNRMHAQNLYQRFRALRLDVPQPAEIYAYAAEKWPAHKLHQLAN